MPDLAEHHRSIEYCVADYALRADDFQVTPLDDGRRIKVVGVCPACGGRTITVWAYGSGNGYKGLRRRRRPSQAPPRGARTVCCDCGHAHAERPDDALFLGCGAYWQVELAGEQ